MNAFLMSTAMSGVARKRSQPSNPRPHALRCMAARVARTIVGLWVRRDFACPRAVSPLRPRAASEMARSTPFVTSLKRFATDTPNAAALSCATPKVIRSRKFIFGCIHQSEQECHTLGYKRATATLSEFQSRNSGFMRRPITARCVLVTVLPGIASSASNRAAVANCVVSRSSNRQSCVSKSFFGCLPALSWRHGPIELREGEIIFTSVAVPIFFTHSTSRPVAASHNGLCTSF